MLDPDLTHSRKNIYPKVSIVTPSLNQSRFLEETICSVLDQGYPNLEYVIIDGGSTDGSVDIIKKYEKRIHSWLSEKDNGQSSAINKGLGMISGDIWSYLCSDDTLEPNAIGKIVRAFSTTPEAAVIYGNCNFIDEHSRVTRVKKPGPFNPGKMLRNNYLYQPAAFVRIEELQRYGAFDETLRYSMDYEYWLRFAETEVFVYIDESIANYRLHASSKTVQNTLKMMKEMVPIKKKYGLGLRADWIYWNFFVWGRFYYRAKRIFFEWLAKQKSPLVTKDK